MKMHKCYYCGKTDEKVGLYGSVPMWMSPMPEYTLMDPVKNEDLVQAHYECGRKGGASAAGEATQV